jgi:hypothetical protein
MLAALVAAATIGSKPAAASITYNYQQDWIFDSASGLYWQVLPIPTSTFVPSTGRVATAQQLTDLQLDAGANLSGPQEPGAYSASLANLVSFFEADAPAPGPQPGLALTTFAAYDYSITDPPPLNFEYETLTYSAVDPSGLTWLYSPTTTIGNYGPCSPGPDCPPTEPAFVVSTLQPVPLPPGIWVFLSGLASLAYFQVARQRGFARP